jgi:hypothetical protein
MVAEKAEDTKALADIAKQIAKLKQAAEAERAQIAAFLALNN